MTINLIIYIGDFFSLKMFMFVFRKYLKNMYKIFILESIDFSEAVAVAVAGKFLPLVAVEVKVVRKWKRHPEKFTYTNQIFGKSM